MTPGPGIPSPLTSIRSSLKAADLLLIFDICEWVSASDSPYVKPYDAVILVADDVGFLISMIGSFLSITMPASLFRSSRGNCRGE